MENESIYNYLKNNLKNSEIKVNEDMSKRTSFKVGGPADFFVRAKDIEDIEKICKFAKENNINITIIGNGSNLLVLDKGIRGIVVTPDFNKIEIKDINNNGVEVTVGAGVKVPFLAQQLLKESISGLEFAAGIPGTVGGAIRMNAGAYGGEFKDIVETTTCIEIATNQIVELKNKEQEFGYRTSIFKSNKYVIIETKLILKRAYDRDEIKKKMQENLESRKAHQPLEYPSAGSTFKRGENFITAKLIDESGLKGYSIGGAEVSTVHAGFIINKGNATAKDILDLAEYVTKKVKEKFNKEIELEIEVIGEE